MISGLNFGDYFVLVFLCGVMGTRKLAINALDEMIKESRVNEKIKLIMVYLIGLAIGMLICMVVIGKNSLAIAYFLLSNMHSPINQNIAGEVIKSFTTFILTMFVYLGVFEPVRSKIEIITGKK